MEGKTQGRRRRERLGRSRRGAQGRRVRASEGRGGGGVSVNKRCSLPPPPQVQPPLMESAARAGKVVCRRRGNQGVGGLPEPPGWVSRVAREPGRPPQGSLAHRRGAGAALGSPRTRVRNGGWREAESGGVPSSAPQELGCAPLASSLGSGNYQPSGLWHIGVTEGTGGGDLAANQS